MATGNTEGKILGIVCSGCEEDKSVKFCVDCNQPLCQRCVKIHGKMTFGQQHNLIPIEEHQSAQQKPKSYQAVCTKHQKSLTIICETCLHALCTDCTSDHGGHKLLQTNIDATVLHNISAQKIPCLMQILQKLEKLKDGSPEKLQLYKTARDMVKEWKKRLLKIVNEDSDRLLNEIESEIKKQESILYDIATNIGTHITQTDHHMTVLSNARKVSDPNVLLCNIYKCDEATQKAKVMLEKLESVRQSFTIDDLLPTRNQLQKVEKDIHDFLQMTPLTQGRTRASRHGIHPQTCDKPEYGEVKRIADKHIGKIKGDYAYRISETNQHDTSTVVIYDVRGKAVHVLDVNTNTMLNYTCEKAIYRMTSLSQNRHVIRDTSGDVHVVDGSFRVMSTMKRAKDLNNYTPLGMCRKTDNVFIMTEYKGNSNTRLRAVNVENDNTFTSKVLCEVDVDQSFWCLISLNSDMEHVILTDGGQSLAKIHLSTGRCTRIDLSSSLDGGMYSLYLDQHGDILVGDDDGNVHRLKDEKYGGKLIQMKCEKKVSGIAVRGDKVVIFSGEHVYVYQ